VLPGLEVMKEQDMRSPLRTRFAPLLVAALTVAFLPASGTAAAAGNAAAGGAPLRARITGRPIPGTGAPVAPGRESGLPSRQQQIKVLTAVLNRMHKHYKKFAFASPGPQDIFDYGIGNLWRQGIDGAGTTIAVIEGWHFTGIARLVAGFDKVFGLPNPKITTIYPAGKLPPKCPPGMVKLGSYGSCSAWEGELALDVVSAHLIAPYAKILISATPADTEVTDDAASQVAPPEMMEALEHIASGHLANVISISDGTGESTYRHGAAEITAQDPGELAAAAAGIPVLVATGDCGVLQNLAVANGQCEDTSAGPDTAAWDDSPWVTAVGGSVPNLNLRGQRVGPDPVWHVAGVFSEGAGYSSVFARPAYQDGVARITGSRARSVPDITMDAQDGTSEAAPLLNGVLALATQLNHGNVGPINPLLYRVLGPRGAQAGIADVVHGNDSVMSGHKTLVAGFTAAKGFDVASGWGTINAAVFVPSLVAATRAAHEDSAARRQAQAALTALQHGIRLSAASIPAGGTSYLVAGGFLPGHPVRLSVDGRAIATITATNLGTVTYMIDPSLLRLAAGPHVVRLGSMLITMTGTFSSH
jgi:subtilase family serine protease